ncbi:MAG: HAMP domain-containing protein [Bacteroidetes bacterium]|nr:HAMP domain-containing protein [Bacteroidota bacterium]
MKIKDRLALYFTLISAAILVIAMAAIFFAFASFAKSDFYNRLLDRAKVAGQLYLEADEISVDSLSHVRDRYMKAIPGEMVRFYNDKNAPSFIKEKQQYWSPDMINLVRRRKQVEFGEGDRQTVGIYYNDNQGNFVIFVSAEDIQGRHRIEDLIEIMAVMLICVSAALFFIGRWFAKKALAPLDDMVDQVQKVRASNLSVRINEGNGKDEVSKLGQNFNRLLAHLENAFELQQTFVINASHELRTPVTSIIGELELALNKDRSGEEYRQTLNSMLADTERLNETIDSLLELAQVDMSYTQAALSPVAMDDLVWELADYWTKKVGKGKFVVNITGLPEDHEKLQIPANKALLTIALNNIIGNGYKFSHNEPVQCGLDANSERIRITITDCGIGVPPDDTQKIFQSFYRAPNVKNYRGSGIGLYITAKIINLFNGTIEANPRKQGTAFIINFSV